MSKKVIIFGGAGFIGSYVFNELEKRGYDVWAADIQMTKYINHERFIECDILKKKSIEMCLERGTNIVYNFAGLASLDVAINNPVETTELNILGNLYVLDRCREIGIDRFVYASSAYAMSNKGSFYGLSKITSEKIIEEYESKYAIPFSIIRYGSVYGERAYSNNYIYNLIKQVINERRILHYGDGQETREYIHAADAARLSVDIIESEEFKNQNIMLTGIEKMKKIELFTMIKEIFNNDVTIEFKINENIHHYKITPYSYQHPTISRKFVANPFIDMGQGLLECVKEVMKEREETTIK